MKKILLGLGIASSLINFAQISEGGLPTTFDKTVVGEYIDTRIDYQEVILAKPNLASAIAEDSDASVKGKPYRVALLQSVSLSISNSGTWKSLPNGDKIWQLAIRIPDAQALSLQFSSAVVIPEGGKLHAYNGSHSQFVGAYTSKTPTFYSMEMIEGEVLTLEYYMPYGLTELPTISISNVAYYYRGVEGHINAFRDGAAVYKTHQSCEVDVACSEIAGWEGQRDAVVHYSFSVTGGLAVCSGSVINNTANDCTPYILTANHCGEPTSSTNINNHTWYFNYQRPTCVVNNTAQYTGARSQTISGGTLRASSQLGNQATTTTNLVSGSDFTLVELNSTIPAAYNAYFAGWNSLSTSPNSGVGIHHPAGDEKKISTYTNSPSSATYNGGWNGAHWRVTWTATTNGHGVTEGGSSGSPLFNQDGLIVGHLSGGSSFCTATSSPDLYGKMNKAWDQEGSNANQQLKIWLDPTNTGVTTLAGSYDPCSTGGGGGTSTGICVATSTICDEYIENVTLNTINNTSTCNNYSDFTSTTTILTQGQSYTLNVATAIVGSTNTAYTDDEVAAWIDWNNDGDFNDNGEQIAYVLISTGSSTIFNFTVPSTSVTGSLTMRVRMSYQPDDGTITPCGTSSYGEVEDYTVVIQNAGTANGIEESLVNSITIYPNPTQTSFTVDLSSVTEEVEKVELRDLTGRLLVVKTSNQGKVNFDLENESKGFYSVVVYTSHNKVVKKVIRL